jgi:hypothetical protein
MGVLMEKDLIDILEDKMIKYYETLENDDTSLVQLELKKICVEEDLAVLESYATYYKTILDKIEKILEG